jgi:hypothetical protein
MKIPKKIFISILNKKKLKIEAETLFSIKIFKNEDSWYNSTALKTNKNGEIEISQEQLITFINEHENPNLFAPHRIIIEIWNCKITNNILNQVKSFESVNEEQVKKELTDRGFNEDDIIKYTKTTLKKLKEDILFWTPFYNVKNCEISLINETITDYWLDDSEKNYEFFTK